MAHNAISLWSVCSWGCWKTHRCNARVRYIQLHRGRFAVCRWVENAQRKTEERIMTRRRGQPLGRYIQSCGRLSFLLPGLEGVGETRPLNCGLHFERGLDG